MSPELTQEQLDEMETKHIECRNCKVEGEIPIWWEIVPFPIECKNCGELL